MRNPLIKILAVATMCLPYSVHAQKVKVKDNRNQQIQRVELFYKRTGDVDWVRAKDDLVISENAIWLRLSIRFHSLNPSPPKLRVKVELRRVCETPVGPGLNSRVTEYFTSTPSIEGVDLPVNRDRVEVEIPLEPCEDGCIPNNADSLVCRLEDPDHLGEGPYQAIITVGPEKGSLQDMESPRLVYNYDYATAADSRLSKPLSPRVRRRLGLRR